VEAVGEVNEENGVLLLVDMGSLSTFSEEIVRQTGIDVRTVDMVTTPIVLEAARKTALIDTQLETLHESLKNFHGYADIRQSETKQIIENWKTRAIIAICASGEGTARRMKELIEEAVLPQIDWHLEVIPLSIVNMKEVLPKIQEDYEIIA
ncbi:transcription antiterminator BglG, partial [Enterococcus gallinarum]|nr:transcription antiterminator BglG [Enterococcus gallinarum]